jgi:hypothetical protein
MTKTLRIMSPYYFERGVERVRIVVEVVKGGALVQRRAFYVAPDLQHLLAPTLPRVWAALATIIDGRLPVESELRLRHHSPDSETSG